MVGLNYHRILRRHRSLHRRSQHFRRGDLDNWIRRLGKLPPLPMGVFHEDVDGSNRRDVVGGRSKTTHSKLVGIAIVEWEGLPDYTFDLAAHIVAERRQHYVAIDEEIAAE